MIISLHNFKGEKMLSFKDFLEQQEEEPDYLLLEVPIKLLSNIVLESYWQEYDSTYSYRVDPEDPKIPLQRHVHIAKTKHTSNKNMQVSWNVNGTRHDKGSFNDNVGKNKKVREIAKKVLKLDSGITLEHYTESDTDNTLLLECVYNSENIKILLVK